MKKVKFYENERLDIVDAAALAELPYGYMQQVTHAMGLGYANGIIPDVIHSGQGRLVPGKTRYYDEEEQVWKTEEKSFGSFVPTDNFQSEDKRPVVDNSAFTLGRIEVSGRFYVYRSNQGMWDYTDDVDGGKPDQYWANKSGGTGVITCFDGANPDQPTTITVGVTELLEDVNSRGESAAKEWSIWARRLEHPVANESRRFWSVAASQEVLQAVHTRVEGLVEFACAPTLDSEGKMRAAGWVRAFDGVGMYKGPLTADGSDARYASGPVWRPVLAFDYWRQWAGNAKNVAMSPNDSYASRASFPYWPGSKSGGTGGNPIEPIIGNIHNRFDHLDLLQVKNTSQVSGYYRWLTSITDTVKKRIRPSGPDNHGPSKCSNFDAGLESNYEEFPIGYPHGIDHLSGDLYHIMPGTSTLVTGDSSAADADIGFVGNHTSAQSFLFDSNGQPGRAFDLYDCLMNSDDPIFGQNCTSLGELVFRLARAVSQLRSGTDLDPYLFRRTYERQAKTAWAGGPRKGTLNEPQTQTDLQFGTGTAPTDSWFQHQVNAAPTQNRQGSFIFDGHNTDTVRPLSHLEEFYDNYAFAHPHILYQGSWYWSANTARVLPTALGEPEDAQQVNHLSGGHGIGLFAGSKPSETVSNGWLPVGRQFNPHKCSIAKNGGYGAFRSVAPRTYSRKSQMDDGSPAVDYGSGDHYAAASSDLALPNPQVADAASMLTRGFSPNGIAGYPRLVGPGNGWGDGTLIPFEGGFEFCLMVPCEFQITAVHVQPLSTWGASNAGGSGDHLNDLRYEWVAQNEHQPESSQVHYNDTLYRNTALAVNASNTLGIVGSNSVHGEQIHKRILVHVNNPTEGIATHPPKNFNITVYGNYFRHTGDFVYRNEGGTNSGDRTAAHNLGNAGWADQHMKQLWRTPRSLTRVSAMDQHMSGYGDTLAYGRVQNSYTPKPSEAPGYLDDSTAYEGGPTTYGYQYGKRRRYDNVVGFGQHNQSVEQQHPWPVSNLGGPNTSEGIANTGDIVVEGDSYIPLSAQSPAAPPGCNDAHNMNYLAVDMGGEPNPYLEVSGIGAEAGLAVEADIGKVNPPNIFPSIDWWSGYPGQRGVIGGW